MMRGPSGRALGLALGCVLDGTNVYQGRTEQHGLLGDGAPPAAGDIARAITLSRLVSAAALVLAAGAARLRRAGPDPRAGQ